MLENLLYKYAKILLGSVYAKLIAQYSRVNHGIYSLAAHVINKAPAYTRLKQGYGIVKSFWPCDQQSSLYQAETRLWHCEVLLATAKWSKTCCNFDRQYKKPFFSTCGSATNTSRLFYTNTVVSITR